MSLLIAALQKNKTTATKLKTFGQSLYYGALCFYGFLHILFFGDEVSSEPQKKFMTRWLLLWITIVLLVALLLVIVWELGTILLLLCRIFVATVFIPLVLLLVDVTG
jgi:membrane-associated HD superfamily phosphohydrolase